MDALDIFRKLTTGVKFSKKSFAGRKPAVKPTFDVQTNVVKVEDDDVKIKEEILDDSYPSFSGDNNEQEIKEDEVKPTYNEEQLKEKVNRTRKQNSITVSGKNVPPPIETFDDSYILPQVLKNIYKMGYTTPTPIQMQAIPIMMQGRQILACAPTGSGKTMAFLIPVINSLKKPKSDGFRALIVCPTRELARQIFRECTQLTEQTGLRTYLISKLTQKHMSKGEEITKKCDILITTPNRLVYILRQEEAKIDLKHVEWLIVDESDKLFEVGVRGFREQLGEIYRACDSVNIKRAMFSATHTVQVAKWCKKNLKGMISVGVGHRNTAVNLVEQKLEFVGNEHGKLIAFRNLITEGLHPPVLVFVQSKDRAKELFSELLYDGINVDIIHSDRTQVQRDNVVRAFREGKIWVLICTELMGRGIDFKGINLVVNYDFPQSAISYIHRIGRTGRAGRPGKAITFFTEDDKPALRTIATVMRDSGCAVPEFMLSLKKQHKRTKRKLEQRAPVREAITTAPTYKTNVNKKKRKKVAE
ncbi:probable ATP-dependent RNA helicase DDX52 [Nilaparvata lugens]|uniref:probable ATP-dependent RNA helicase DDX52 n=1 Tax=Nilaparvata lugens TaxID=108931 RepID=UPI00193EAEE6|nr:probable ATP-dependent RNA helicase DDX52 [Nilaparvata lugens]